MHIALLSHLLVNLMVYYLKSVKFLFCLFTFNLTKDAKQVGLSRATLEFQV